MSRLYFQPHTPQSGDLNEYYLGQIHYDEGCFPGLDLATNSKIVLSADGTVSGECLYQTGSGDNYEKITGTLEGTVQGDRIEFSVTTVRDYAGPMVITDRDHKEIGWHNQSGHIELAYQANGTFTSANEANGEAYFAYTCSVKQTNLRGAAPYGVENQCPGSTADPLKVSRSDSGSMSGKTTFLIQFESAPSHVPLIFVPGVGGSMLELEGTLVDRDLWPTATAASRTRLMLEADGFTPAVADTQVIARDIIRYDSIYGPLLKALAAQGYKEEGEGADLFILPYDWRLDNTQQVLALAKKVDEVLQQTGSQKVNILTHSMGGLIARAYVNSIGQDKVDTLVTISMPMYGSPKVLYGLISGYTFSNWSVRQPLMKILMQNWPSTYQLIGRKPFIVDDKTGQLLPLDAWHRLRYRGFASVVENGLLDTYVETDDNVWSPNPKLVRDADAFHRMLIDPATGQERPLPPGVKHYAIMGYGVRTLAFWRLKDWTPRSSWNPLSVFGQGTYLELDGRKVILEPIFLDGDGTVPLWGLNLTSATGKYLFPYLDKAHSGEHTAITAYPQVHDLMQDLFRGQAPTLNNLPVPEERLDPNRWLYFIEGTDFTLHSDANLTIVDERTGDKIGFNDAGEIEETLTSGSFLSTQGAEYASIADVQGSYRVQVKGIRDGAFRLTVAVAQGGQTTTFDYGPVPVKQGTVAEVRIVPNLIGPDVPPLEVTTDGNKSTVAAQSGPGIPQSSAGGSPTLPDTPIPGSQPPASAGDSGATQTNRIPILVVLAACLTTLAGVGLLVVGITIMVRHKRRLPI